jgi:hypothetical protein
LGDETFRVDIRIPPWQIGSSATTSVELSPQNDSLSRRPIHTDAFNPKADEVPAIVIEEKRKATKKHLS